MQAWVKQKGVVLRGGGLDESPHVYRRLPEVLAAQEGTVEVLHTLTPLVVVMAGADEFDPYKEHRPTFARMLLTITTTHQPATDLGYLLHKNPARPQSFELSFGQRARLLSRGQRRALHGGAAARRRSRRPGARTPGPRRAMADCSSSTSTTGPTSRRRS